MPSSTPSFQDGRETLRRGLRAARRALPEAYRLQAASLAAERLRTHAWYRHARRIGCYVAHGSEMETRHLMLAARAERRELYLPVVVRPSARLRFARSLPQSAYQLNRYGIPEPTARRSRDMVTARNLDLVLVPLVGFDTQGNRLGSGAGYYDRSFDFRLRLHDARPRLVGLAFDCQETAGLQRAGWDVPLDAIVTESRLILCHP